MSDAVYGIDLGTTYSAIATINDFGQATVIKNFEGADTTPSVVWFGEDDEVVVGDEAKRGAATDPDNTCALIKREMGTDYRVEYQCKEWTPESISGLILRELVNAANEETSKEINKVVITVPAYFGTQEKEATRQAGTIAGLEVVGIVTEPVAAALSLGIGNEEEQTIMVYDLGGGTFDTTIMKIGAGKVEVVAVEGNRTLGGADWDEALVGLLISKFAQATGTDEDDLRSDEDFLNEVQLTAEDVKKSLTKKKEVPVNNLQYEGNREKIMVSRDEFEAATHHLIKQTVEISQRTVDTAKAKDPSLSVDRVLLVGGSSRMPQVAAALKNDLGWDTENTNFDLAVAEGAAIYGQAAVEEILETDGGETPAGDTGERKFYLGGATALNIKNVLARSLGIEFKNPENDSSYIGFFAHANDSLPSTPEPIQARTIVEHQTKVTIKLYEQAGETESDQVEANRLLKEMDLPFAEPMPKESPIDIQAHIDAEGLVKVEAVDPKSKNKADMEVSVAMLSEEQVQQATSQVASMTLRS